MDKFFAASGNVVPGMVSRGARTFGPFTEARIVASFDLGDCEEVYFGQLSQPKQGPSETEEAFLGRMIKSGCENCSEHKFVFFVLEVWEEASNLCSALYVRFKLRRTWAERLREQYNIEINEEQARDFLNKNAFLVVLAPDDKRFSAPEDGRPPNNFKILFTKEELKEACEGRTWGNTEVVSALRLLNLT